MSSNNYTRLLNHRILSKKETYKLIAQYQETSEIKVKQFVVEKLIRHNFKYIYKLSLSFYKSHKHSAACELDDCVQVASLAVEKAISRFNTSLGYNFTTYLTFWIKSFLQRHYQSVSRTTRIPVHVQDLARKIRKYTKEYALHNNGRSPSTVEIGHALQVAPQKIKDTLHAMKPTTSLDKFVGDEETSTLLDLVADDKVSSPSTNLETLETTECLHELLCTLSPTYRRVLELRYGLDGNKPMSLAKVGEILGCTRECVRLREKKAMTALRGRRDTHTLKELYIN